jgi:membrane fusion protein, multidrug efflux system
MDEPIRRSETDALSRKLGGRKSRLRPALYLLAVLLAALGAWQLLTPAQVGGKRQRQEPTQVGAAKIAKGDISDALTGLGTVTPLATITVQTQIAGQLMSVGFKEGQIVEKGDFLAQIDQRPFEALKAQFEGQLVHDQGVLDQARLDNVRFQTLLKQDSIARQQAEDQAYIVKQDEGTVKTDQALINAQALNIFYCHIVAPVTGRVGLRLVDPGNYVQVPNTNGLVVLTQLEPISVVFVLPEDNIQAVWEEVRAGKTLSVTTYNRTDDKQIATGALESIDNEVDTTTGTVKIRANFPNADLSLFPNQFVNARLLLRTLHGVTLSPVAAVQHGAPGDFVYLIKPDNTVAVQVVTTGVTEGDQVQILSGLNPGDTVVVDGADRLRDGAKIRIVPDQANIAATMNNGPGAPPDEQPSNASAVRQGKGLEANGRKQQAQSSPAEQSNDSRRTR